VVLRGGSSLVYGTKGVLTGNQWNFSEPMNLLPVNGSVDLQLTANDIPYIACKAGNFLSYTTYDRIQGRWTTGILDEMLFDNFCMAADFQGGIGMAYLTEGDNGITLGYAYNDGSGTWSTEHLWDTIPLDVSMPNPSLSIGLAFDMENNPVISFSTGNGIWIAYDPIITIPEPATMALLLLGGAFSLRLRKPR
jgi:hypothetical protein